MAYKLIFAFSGLALSMACGGGNTASQGGDTAPGADRSAETAALETAANLIQAAAPVEAISMYLDGFHVAKDDAAMQMEAHHYCNQVNEDFAQCVLFDGNTADARMTGLEYIISEGLYESLPVEEKTFWHPHNYEILSGQLQLPGVPDVAEQEALRRKVNSYGKTWHTWMSGVWQREPDALPLGPARLQWSFNGDGEAAPEMIAARDARMGIDTAADRAARSGMASLARPQGGVAALASSFRSPASPMPGVSDNGDRSTRSVPRFAMVEPDGAAAR